MDDTTQPLRCGKYPLIRRLGQGGMGEVWLSHHPDLDIPVAVKTLSPLILASDPGFADRFLKEARTAARITHPNAVHVLDAGQDQGAHYIVMEFVGGGDVAELLEKRGGPLAVDEALTIIEIVAHVLASAAGLGLVHRDLKPQNIMLTESGEVKLADLGIAKVATGEAAMTGTGVILGTPSYMAPEQAMDSSRVDQRADIYALGITLFHLLTGRLPFHADSPVAVLMAQVAQELPDPLALNPRIPPDIVALLRKMTAKDPDDRYQSPTELIAAIAALSGRDRPLPSASTRPHRFFTLPATRPRRRWPGIAAAALLLVCVLATAGWGWTRWRHRTGSPAAVAPDPDRQAAAAKIAASAEFWLRQRITPARYALAQTRNAFDAYAPLAPAHAYVRALVRIAVSPPGWGGADEGLAGACEDLAAAGAADSVEIAEQAAKLLSALEHADRGETRTLTEPRYDSEILTAALHDLGMDYVTAHWRKPTTLPELTAHAKAIGAAFHAQDPEALVALSTGAAGPVVTVHGNCPDLSCLASLPVATLSSNSNVPFDLSALQGMPLREICLTASPVKSVAPLAYAPLTVLLLANDKDAPSPSLIPLRGKRLTWLEMNGRGIDDMIAHDVLADMPLVHLSLDYAAVTNLEFCRNMPLRALHLNFPTTAGALDLSPLRGKPLERLVLLGWQEVRNPDSLTGMPLQSITVTRLTTLEPLVDAPLVSVNIQGCPIADLGPLAGKALIDLTVAQTPVADLSPIAGAPLRTLWAHQTRVADLSPLRGMKLERLSIQGTPVRDIGVVADMPLEAVIFDADTVEDYSCLRDIPTLKTINNKPAAQFWREHGTK